MPWVIVPFHMDRETAALNSHACLLAGVVHIVALELYAKIGELVNERGFHFLVRCCEVETHVSPAEVIHQNKNDVWPRAWGSLRSCLAVMTGGDQTNRRSLADQGKNKMKK
mmetsp:Transcript_582/g.1338  ORF Transcript_582/g.1338 Transcript_582/m.1338 type:complete len:111 (-) Transcript_582:58-390(-)